MRVVQIGEMTRGVPPVRSSGVAHSTRVLGGLVSGRVTESLGSSSAAVGGGYDGGSESSVNEVGDAAARTAVLIARVGRGGGEREGRGG